MLGRWLVLVTVILLVGCGSEVEEIVLQLEPQEASGQPGTATLRAEGSSTRVTVEVSPVRSTDEPQPVHVHFGRCGPSLGSVAYPLEDISDGRSETVVAVALSSLRDGGHAVNVHKSYPEIRVYTACGSIPIR